jgi:hypothetical protein
MFAMLPLVSAGLALLSASAIDTSVPDEPGQDPLGPAQSGMVQCYVPDTASHTCRAIARYRRDHGGAWIDTATIRADPALPLTADIEIPVAVRGAAVCGTVSRQQVLAGKLYLLDRQVPAQSALPVLVQLADAMTGTIGREMCTRYVPAAGGLEAQTQIAGVTAPIAPQRVIWVRGDAGFRVQSGGAGG